MSKRLISPSSSPTAKLKGQKQTIDFAHMFFTQSDVAYISDHTKVSSQIAQRAMERLRMIGLTSPTEPSFGNIASSVAAIRSPDSTGPALYNIVGDLKAATEHTDAAPAWVVCPSSPSELQVALPELYDAAYASEAPSNFESQAYRTIRRRCPVRITGKALRVSGNASPSQSSTPDSLQLVAAVQQSTERMLTSFVQTFMVQPDAGRIVVRRGAQGTPTIDDVTEAQSVEDGPAGPTVTPTFNIRNAGGVAADGCAGAIVEAAIDDMTLVQPSAAKATPDAMSKFAAIAGKHALTKKPSSKSPSPKSHAIKRPAAAVAKLSPLVKKKPSIAGKKGSLKLGCSRCRGSKVGCLSCRDPSFTGKRFQL